MDTAQALFHRRGYAALGVAALTDALGIKPPSFYAAFGSKADFFEQVMARYSRAALPVDAILRPGRDPAEALGELLATAARVYTENDGTRGCLVIEAARDCETDVAAAARGVKGVIRATLRDYVAVTHPDLAEQVADFMDVALGGMSAAAREGWSEERLLPVAQAGREAIKAMLATD